jgi:hypothetical protein
MKFNRSLCLTLAAATLSSSTAAFALEDARNVLSQVRAVVEVRAQQLVLDQVISKAEPFAQLAQSDFRLGHKADEESAQYESALTFNVQINGATRESYKCQQITIVEADTLRMRDGSREAIIDEDAGSAGRQLIAYIANLRCKVVR